MILDMRNDCEKKDVEQATIILNASLYVIVGVVKLEEAKIVAFDSFAKERVCLQDEMEKFLRNIDTYCPKLQLFDLSRACSPDVDLNSEEAKKFNQFVKFIKENTSIDIVATPELEKRFPILLQKNKEPDKLLAPHVIQLQEEKYSSLQAMTKLQAAELEKNLSPELCRNILEHSNSDFITQEIISAIDTKLGEGVEQRDQYLHTLLGCMAGRYISPDNFDALVNIAEKRIPQENITMEDINFCFGLQKESSQSEATFQRVNNLIKELIPHLPEDVRQKLDEEAALKEKQQQEYLQKRQLLQAKVDEYRGYLLLSDAIHNYEDVTSEDIRKITDTVYDGVDKYPEAYKIVLKKINEEGDEDKIKAASHWIEPITFKINSLGPNKYDEWLLDNLTSVVTKNQDVRHRYGHIFCEQLKKGNDDEFWKESILQLLDNNKGDHILLMNTYEDLEQAYIARPELIEFGLDLFKNTLQYPDIEQGFRDHLSTLASIVGDTAKAHPEFTDTAVGILSELENIDKKKLYGSDSYLTAKINGAFEAIKENEMNEDAKRSLIILHEEDPQIFAGVVKEIMNDPKTDKQRIGNVIELRVNSGLNALIDDYDSPECVKWNLAVLGSDALHKKDKPAVNACAREIFKDGVIKQFEKNPDYDPSEVLQAITDVAPSSLKTIRERVSEAEDLLLLQHIDRFPKETQKLYIGECTYKMDNLVTTGLLKDFPEAAAQKLKAEVCDYILDISATSTYAKGRSLESMEKWATTLKEIGGYSRPEVCVAALNEAMRIRYSVAIPKQHSTCERACTHFCETGEDIKPFIKISTDIIDNVFEKICLHKGNPALTDALKSAKYTGIDDKHSLAVLMGEEAAKAFLSGDGSYKDLWDKHLADKSYNAYIMFKKPAEILQDTKHDERLKCLNKIGKNTYLDDCSRSWAWKDFPELVPSDVLSEFVESCPDKADKTVAEAVKTCYKARFDNILGKGDLPMIKSLMLVYDAEAQKGIEDKEIFSILYNARFSKNGAEVQRRMQDVCDQFDITSSQLKKLSENSNLINWNRLRLKPQNDK